MKSLLAILLLVTSFPAFAHHPGERLDEVMAGKEAAFEPTDLRSIPDLTLTDRQGATLTVRDLRESIVVLSFVPRDCGTPCTEQQDVLASVQEKVNITPMKQIVKFLTIRNRDFPEGTPWDHVNWQSAAPSGETVTESARRFSALSDRNPASPLIHIIDRGGRHAGLFHGKQFRIVNLVLYINGLTNMPAVAEKSAPDTWWDYVTGLFK